MTVKEMVYLVFAAAAFVPIAYFNFLFSLEVGTPVWFAVPEFYAQATLNPASSSLAWDATIVGIAFIVFIYLEGRRINMPYYWVFVVLPFVHSIAFAGPLFLFFRERHLRLS